MRIKKFNQFLESISGTELVGHMGPNYGEWVSPNTISSSDTNLIYSELDDKFYNEDEYNELYNNYLKKSGVPLQGGFCKKNIDEIITFLNTNI
jgi:hypothetical protein